ncbi:hypothetical protein ACTHHL_15755 [Aeribacillus composti]|uniref:hypothetical protein n=1 Tax=Aeribacillus composti TaxID=1868734 RepID=UPI00406A6F08
MITSKLVWFDIKKLHVSWFTYLSLLLSVIPAYGIAYAIKNLNGPFNIYHITSFYALLGSILCVVLSMRLFTDDIHNEILTLLFNKKENRKKYLFAKFIGAIYVGFLFGIICTLVIIGSEQYLKINTGNLYLKSIINYILFTSFYVLLFFYLSTFYRKVTVLFVIAVLSISFLPNLIMTAIDSKMFPDIVVNIIEYTPIYFLPIKIGSHNFSSMEYIITLLSIVFLFFLSTYSILRQDY